MDVPLHPSLDGHVALISGANRGLGAQVAVELARRGATVIAGARDPAQLEGAADATDGAIVPVRLDVTDEASIVDAVDAVGPRLDILVNNAAIGDWKGAALHTLDTEKMDAVLATNLRGPMILSKHALPKLLQHRGARIVNVSSGMGGLTHGMGGTAPTYRVSKAGLNALTAYLDGEYGSRGLISASVCPGWVRTDMGGTNATRSLEEGAASIVHACCLAEGAPSGLFWRDGRIIDW